MFTLIQLIQSFLQFLIGNIIHLRFVVNREQVNQFCYNIEMSNDPRSTGFAFAFGGDSKPYFKAIIADRGAHGRLP